MKTPKVPCIWTKHSQAGAGDFRSVDDVARDPIKLGVMHYITEAKGFPPPEEWAVEGEGCATPSNRPSTWRA